MRHITLTCEDHPDLRWGCKEDAVSEEGRYWGGRTLFYHGDPDQPHYGEGYPNATECDCPLGKLIALSVWKKRHEG